MLTHERKIVVFIIDNCTAHNDMPTLDYTKIVCLPVTITSKLQPLGQCVINKFIIKK